MTAQYDKAVIDEYQILCLDLRCHYGLQEVPIIIGDIEDCAYEITMLHYTL